MSDEIESLKRNIEFLENKMKDPKVYGEWKSRMQPQLKELKEELAEINCVNCKKFLMIGICNYSDICEDFEYFEPREKETK